MTSIAPENHSDIQDFGHDQSKVPIIEARWPIIFDVKALKINY
jgi:hypothetical protein